MARTSPAAVSSCIAKKSVQRPVAPIINPILVTNHLYNSKNQHPLVTQSHCPDDRQVRHFTATSNIQSETDDSNIGDQSIHLLPLKERQPNRFTSIYQQMKVNCAHDIKAYAVCVEKVNHSSDMGLQKDSCQNEFSKVKECFQDI